jgi:predicted nucleic-acid-binding protein
LQLFKNSEADFSDCLIERVSHDAGCSHTVTFDGAASEATGMVLL